MLEATSRNSVEKVLLFYVSECIDFFFELLATAGLPLKENVQPVHCKRKLVPEKGEGESSDVKVFYFCYINLEKVP